MVAGSTVALMASRIVVPVSEENFRNLYRYFHVPLEMIFTGDTSEKGSE